MILISSANKHVNIDEEIPITTEAISSTSESMEIIKFVVDKLHEEIEFLKEELREKNMLIKILNFRMRTTVI